RVPWKFAVASGIHFRARVSQRLSRRLAQMNIQQLRRVIGLAILVGGATVLLSAQENAPKDSDTTQKTTNNTGCVDKGQETGGYYLKDDDGKTWELTDSDAKVADHVGHKVTLSGVKTRESKSDEAQKAAAEKAEANGKHGGDFRVTSVKMISDSCQ